MAGLLRHIAKALGSPAPAPQIVFVGNTPLQVTFRRNERARRMILRFTKDHSGLVVTLPKRATQSHALDFVDKSTPWILRQMQHRSPTAIIADGSSISLRGVAHVVKSAPSRRGVVTIDPIEPVIHVPGDAPHFSRRLKDWLKKQARLELTTASSTYARAMDVKIGRISIRDQKSRWGSCSPAGDLSYSWRLILAPPFVLDYVAAHEVAHRLQMNHGPKFWRLVLKHCPHTREAKEWFKLHGTSLHQIRF